MLRERNSILVNDQLFEIGLTLEESASAVWLFFIRSTSPEDLSDRFGFPIKKATKIIRRLRDKGVLQ
jgi:hypothetical protein